MPFPDRATWDLEKILSSRLALLSETALFDTLSEYYPNESARQRFKDELETSGAQVLNTLTQLWSVDEPRRSPDPMELARSLVVWHNGNIRDASQSIVALSDSPSDPRLLEEGNPRTLRRRARNVFYRHLVVDHTARADAPHSLSDSVRIFTAERENTGEGNLPFYFLRYRMLAHLVFKRRTRSVKSLILAFLKYGIAPERTVEVLNDLTRREYFDSGYVRVEGPHGQIDEPTLDDPNVMVRLLPAGKYLATELVLKCEFLYWNALDNPEALDHFIEVKGLRKEEVAASIPNEEETALGAIVFVNSYLLPRFREEHPYMVPGATWTPADARRLTDFRTDFGYDKNNWFILRLRKSIRAYANEAGARFPDEINRSFTYLDECAAQLDRVIKDEPAVVRHERARL